MWRQRITAATTMPHDGGRKPYNGRRGVVHKWLTLQNTLPYIQFKPILKREVCRSILKTRREGVPLCPEAS